MAALIRCVLHINPEELEEEEFYKAWCQVKHFMSIAYQVKFS